MLCFRNKFALRFKMQTARIFRALFLLLPALAGTFLSGQAPPTPPVAEAPPVVLVVAPALSAELQGALAKADHKNLKRCAEESPKHQAQTASACVALGEALWRLVPSPAEAKVSAEQAFQRSCALGAAEGCLKLGNAQFQTGRLPVARLSWTSLPCAGRNDCKLALFEALMAQQPVDLADAELIGMPLCDGGHQEAICASLVSIGSKQDFTAIAQRHKEQHIDELQKALRHEQSNLTLGEGALALAQSGAGSATGVFQILYYKGQVAMYQSGIRSSQEQIARMQGELASLGASARSDGPGFGAMMGSLAMQGVAHANTVQSAGAQVTPASFMPVNTVSSSVLSPLGSSGSTAGDLYQGPHADWVHTMLKTAGPYTCTPNGAPKVNKNFSCQRDAYVLQAQLLAWGAECSEQTGAPGDSVKDAQVMMEALHTAKSLCESSSLKTTCQSDTVLSCSRLP